MDLILKYFHCGSNLQHVYAIDFAVQLVARLRQRFFITTLSMFTLAAQFARFCKRFLTHTVCEVTKLNYMALSAKYDSFFVGWAISRCLSTAPHPMKREVIYFLFITLQSYFWPAKNDSYNSRIVSMRLDTMLFKFCEQN